MKLKSLNPFLENKDLIESAMKTVDGPFTEGKIAQLHPFSSTESASKILNNILVDRTIYNIF